MLLKYLKDKVSDVDFLEKTQLYADIEKEFERKKRNEAIKNFAFGFTVGSLVTGVTALFLMPQSGKEFRKDAKETVYRVVNVAEEKGEKIKKKGHDIIEKGQDMVEKKHKKGHKMMKKAEKFINRKKEDLEDYVDNLEDVSEEYVEELQEKLK
ncbi:MAG: YtxH domain-containing protein, partial [Clostridia bacterium]